MKFNGVTASNYVVDSASQVRAVVPVGASTGQISVAASGGTAVSAASFVVIIAPGLQVIAPNGGENWLQSSTQEIKWSWTGEIVNVKLDYSLDGGTVWTEINSSTENDGNYNWTVPVVESSNCKVRISDVVDGDPLDVSDGVFTITGQSTEMEIVINGDDAYELYVNGDFVGGNDQWDVAQTYSVSVLAGKNVMAVYGRNRGGEGAWIGEVKLDGSVVLKTGSNWRRNVEVSSGWTAIDYDDGGWLSAVEHGQYGVSPWHKNIQGFPENSQAQWIWSEDTKDSQKEWYFRGTFQPILTKKNQALNSVELLELQPKIILPSDFALFQNFPNPFNSETIVQYQIPIEEFVNVEVFDINGRRITILINEQKSAGTYQINWDATDFSSNAVSTGIYIVKINAGSFSDFIKVILMR